jgi:hypothetical protein
MFFQIGAEGLNLMPLPSTLVSMIAAGAAGAVMDTTLKINK